MKLKDKKAIVTGSSRGIGRSIALALAREGASVVINYHTSEKKAQAVAEKIHSIGQEAMVIKADVSNKDAVKRIINETVQEFGSIDILVNNAGIVRRDPIHRLSEADWDQVIDTNLRGPFLCSKYAGRQMIEQEEGTIINISSIAGLQPEINLGAYSVSKAGLIRLSQVLAMELSEYNVRVNTVCPGPVETPMMKEAYDTPTLFKARTEAIPMKRFAKPEEIADLVVFLASDNAKYITGEHIVIDGGSTRSMYYLVDKLGKKIKEDKQD